MTKSAALLAAAAIALSGCNLAKHAEQAITGVRPILTGWLMSKDGECPLVHGDDGYYYGLVGEVPADFRTPMRVRVFGEFMEPGRCPKGSAVQIARIDNLR